MPDAAPLLTITDYLIIAAYFLVILVVGALTGRKQEKEEFLISGRKLTSLQATTTIFSSRIGAAILLTYTALVYMYGMGALWYFVGSVFGLFVFYFFGLKVNLGQQYTCAQVIIEVVVSYLDQVLLSLVVGVGVVVQFSKVVVKSIIPKLWR